MIAKALLAPAKTWKDMCYTVARKNSLIWPQSLCLRALTLPDWIWFFFYGLAPFLQFGEFTSKILHHDKYSNSNTQELIQ